MSSIPVCLKTVDQCVVICVDRVPKVGDVVSVTKDNVYRGGGCREVPGFSPGHMIGKKWRIIKGLQSNDVSTFFVEEAE
jgi:hypothetical protein